MSLVPARWGAPYLSCLLTQQTRPWNALAVAWVVVAGLCAVGGAPAARLHPAQPSMIRLLEL